MTKNQRTVAVLTFLCTLAYALSGHASQPSKQQLYALRSAKSVLVILDICCEPDADVMPFESIAQELLEYSGIQVFTTKAKSSAKHDAILKINVDAESLMNIHVGLETHHFSASLAGTISFEHPDAAPYMKTFKGQDTVSSYDADKYERTGMVWFARLAPFEMAFRKKGSFVPVLFEMVNAVYGIKSLAAALKSHEWYVRRWAIITLALTVDSMQPTTKHDFPIQALIVALRDKYVNVRAPAAVALGETRDARAVGSLIAALQDDHHEVRKSAALALGLIKDSRAIPALIATLKDSWSDVQIQAELALEKITGHKFGRNAAKWEDWWSHNKERYLKKLNRKQLHM